MRPAISWSDLQGSRVGLWGLGTEGSANLRRLRSMGIEPVIVDDHPERIRSERVLPTSGQGLETLLTCDAVVKTPGISRRRSEVSDLEEAGVPVVGGLGLWLEEADRSRVVCITGTKGKSTTTSIAAHLAAGLGRRVLAGGNLGRLPYDPAVPSDVDLWVIEVSSYQAADVAVSPPVVAVTSLHPDHLPWHGGAEAYYADKLSLCSQREAHLTVAARSSPLLAERRNLLGPEVLWVDEVTPPPSWTRTLGLLGRHNVVNAAIARACLVALGVPGADDDDAVGAAARGFMALEGRLETVATVDGVDFVDDGLSTNVLSAIAAVDSFPGRRIALIAGGLDRDIDYLPLAEALAARPAATCVLTVYESGPRIQAAVDRCQAAQLHAVPSTDIADAVRRGWAWARPDGVVLLSPAAASFDAFEGARHRGRVFRDAVSRLAGLDG